MNTAVDIKIILEGKASSRLHSWALEKPALRELQSVSLNMIFYYSPLVTFFPHKIIFTLYVLGSIWKTALPRGVPVMHEVLGVCQHSQAEPSLAHAPIYLNVKERLSRIFSE
jgi:hypothetical protein